MTPNQPPPNPNTRPNAKMSDEMSDSMKPLRKRWRPRRTEISFLLNDERPPKRARIDRSARNDPGCAQAHAQLTSATSSHRNEPQAPPRTSPVRARHHAGSSSSHNVPETLAPLRQPSQTNARSAAGPSRQTNMHVDEIQPNTPRQPRLVSAAVQAASALNLALNRHTTANTNQPQVVVNEIPCNICGLLFGNQDAVDRHKRIRHISGKRRQKSVRCPECNLEVRSQQNLRRHAAVHGPDADKECGYCTAKFRTERARTTHWRQMHDEQSTRRSPSKRSFLCSAEGCNYSSNQKTNVKRHHQSVHLKIRRFVCPKCLHAASTKANLQAHMNTHKDDQNSPKRRRVDEGVGGDEEDEDRIAEEGVGEEGDSTETESGNGTDREDRDGAPNTAPLSPTV